MDGFAEARPPAPFDIEAGFAARAGWVLRALDLAIKAPAQPGVRVYNVVGTYLNSSDPVAQVLKSALGPRSEQLDLTWYNRPEQAYAPLYRIDQIEKALGFTPEKSTK